jgi:site-specific recombinase XerD
LAAGFSLKQIGDQLGHQSAAATRVYVKVDLDGLREVAELDLAGVL